MNTKNLKEDFQEVSFSEGYFYPKILKNLAKILHSGTVFIEIGASKGKFIFDVNKIINQSSLYAIEPDPIKFKQLKENCLKWEQGTDNKIYALNIAIGDRDGQASFKRANLPEGGSLLTSDLSQVKDELKEALSWESISVDIFKLDTLFQRIKPDIIKIDVSGSHLPILQGSTGILKQGKTKFLIEFRHQYISEVADNQDEIHKFMKSFDYYPTEFYGMTLFRNSKKDRQKNLLVEPLKQSIRKIIPKSLLYWLRGFFRR
jgi:FkbM family methyltransferase